MKRKLLNLLMLMAFCMPLIAQTENEETYYTLEQDKNNSFSHWSYMIDVGASVFDGDVYEPNGQKLLPSSNFKPSVGINIERSFNPIFGIGLQYKYIPYGAKPSQTIYELKGQANEVHAFLSLDLLNLFYQGKRQQKWNLFANVGFGVSFYNAEMTNKETGEPIPDANNPGGVVKLNNGDSFMWPFSILLEYNISRSFAIGLQGEYRPHNKDNLEGSTVNVRKGNSNDAFTIFSLSLRHKINCHKKAHTRNISYEDINTIGINQKMEDLRNEMKAQQKQDSICCANAMNKIAELEGLLSKKTESVVIITEEKKKEPVIVIVEKIKEVFNLALRGIQFDTDKATIKPVSFPILDNVVDVLKEHSSFELDIIGHTDNVGNATYNMNLSADRANSVKQYLISKGISADRLTASGKGLTDPVATNATAEGKALNRRVEFVVKSNNEVIYKTEKKLY